MAEQVIYLTPAQITKMHDAVDGCDPLEDVLRVETTNLGVPVPLHNDDGVRVINIRYEGSDADYPTLIDRAGNVNTLGN